PGPLRLVAQLNPQRAALKRGAQPVRSLAQPFDPRHFNFTQIRPAEVLFRLRRAPARHPPFEHVLVVINVSPLERG
ncbi:GDPP1 phosphorylase, partial [Crypturellus undulatus]|nr:GDPP1 phosphorylase [Crypturellus undulatus]